MPLGPSILWPVKPTKSASQACTSTGAVGHRLRGVDEHRRAGRVGGVGEEPDVVHGAEHVRHRGEGEELGAVEQPVELA